MHNIHVTVTIYIILVYTLYAHHLSDNVHIIHLPYQINQETLNMSNTGHMTTETDGIIPITGMLEVAILYHNTGYTLHRKS